MRLRAAASFALAASLVVLTTPGTASAWGWDGLQGDGKKVTQPRQVGEFTSVRLEGSLDVRVKVGAPTAVAVTIDENLQGRVETRLDGATLVISTKDMSYRGEGRVDLSTPSLRGFAIEGSGDVTIDGGQGDLALSVAGSGDLSWRGAAGRLQASIDGSGDVRLTGTADSASLEVEGSGDISAADLTARSAQVEVSGSGDVSVTLAGGSLTAEVNGSGDIHWRGTAQVERASVSGSGEIVHR